MKTTEQRYIEYICSVCKNKDKDVCEIRRKLDRTMYCSGYDTILEKRKKTPTMWQGW